MASEQSISLFESKLAEMLDCAGHWLVDDDMSEAEQQSAAATIDGWDATVKTASELLEACKLALERLKPNKNVRKHFDQHVAYAALGKAVYKAEGGAQ